MPANPTLASNTAASTPELTPPVHFIGIGGAGMSAVARLLLARGIPVSGSDAKESPALDELKSLGAKVFVGHRPENLASAQAVVVSSAIRATNPELLAAQKADIPVIHRSQALAAAMVGKNAIAVAGTHGKTTTTAMITHLLSKLDLSPSFAIGGILHSLNVNAAFDTGRDFVFEADESDGSFLNYAPHIEVVTNVEPDHLDRYGSAEAFYQAFEDFTALLPQGGTLVVCTDDPGSRALQAPQGAKRVGYGYREGAQFRVHTQRFSGLGSHNTVTEVGSDGSRTQYEMVLSVPGEHNVLNALAAFSVGRILGLPAPDVLGALATFDGTARRFDFIGEVQGIRVFDDYAHHPTEVRAALSAGREVAGEHRVHVVFQPHLYSRTQEFASEFAEALSRADEVTLLPIYAAREDPITGVTSEVIAQRLPQAQLVSAEDAVLALAQKRESGALETGDIVVTMGAGDVTELGPRIVEALRGN